MSVVRPLSLLFDWDNTLVDTWPVIHHALGTTFEAMGVEPWTFEQTKARVRRSAREAFPALFGERAPEATRIFYETFEADHLTCLRPAPGAERMLEALREAGYDMAVVSNKQGGYLRREAGYLGWSGYFRRLVGALDAASDKPAPAAVELALDGGPGAQADRARIWLIGDTDVDLECAVNAGCYPVLLRAQAPAAGEFAAAPPALHLRSCADLVDMLCGDAALTQSQD